MRNDPAGNIIPKGGFVGFFYDIVYGQSALHLSWVGCERAQDTVMCVHKRYVA